MKLQMAENSLFAILLRSPWWASFAVAAGVFLALRLVIAEQFASFFAIPFIVIGAVATWRQARAPSTAAIERARQRLSAMAWEEFSALLAAHYAREGYAVTRLEGADADFEMAKAGRVVLVACKRWKAVRTGVEPLRQLHAEGRKRDAAQCIYVAAGEITASAREFSLKNNLQIVDGDALARLRL